MPKTMQCGTADTPEVADLCREHSASHLGNDTLERGFAEPATIRGENEGTPDAKIAGGNRQAWMADPPQQPAEHGFTHLWMPSQMHGSIPYLNVDQILELKERVRASGALSPDDVAEAARQIHEEGLQETEEYLRALHHPDLAHMPRGWKQKKGKPGVGLA
jgi:hypothetical protein